MTAPKLNKIKKGVAPAPRTTVKNNLRTLLTRKGVDIFDEDNIEDLVEGGAA